MLNAKKLVAFCVVKSVRVFYSATSVDGYGAVLNGPVMICTNTYLRTMSLPRLY